MAVTGKRNGDWWATPREVILPELPRFGRALAKVTVVWMPEQSSWVEADVCAVGGAPFVAEFRLGSAASIPWFARRLPSDGAVVQAVRSFGPSGVAALAALTGDQAGLISEIEASWAAHPNAAATSEDLVIAYGRRVSRRGPEKIAREVAHARELLNDGYTTAEIISRLEAQGLGTRTAYRRLKEAHKSNGSAHG